MFSLMKICFLTISNAILCHFKKSGDKGGDFSHTSNKRKRIFNSQGGKNMIHFKSKALQRWVVLIVVSLVGGMITKLPYLKDIYFSTLQAATGTTKTQLGLLLTMYGLMNFICYFPGGMLADKISPKKLIVFSCFGTGAVGLWYATLPGYTSLLIIHALFGITTVFTFWASMVKITNNLGNEDEQGKLFGFLEGGRGLVGTLIALASVFVFSQFVDETKGLSGCNRILQCYDDRWRYPRNLICSRSKDQRRRCQHCFIGRFQSSC